MNYISTRNPASVIKCSTISENILDLVGTVEGVIFYYRCSFLNSWDNSVKTSEKAEQFTVIMV